MELDEMASKIESKEDLIAFLGELIKDLQENPTEWENDTLDRYLNGMWGWLQDLDGWCKNQNIPVPEEPSWRFVGQMFLADKYYE